MQKPTMTPLEFAAKWGRSQAKESAGAKEHFIDLCRMLGVETPNEADPDGEWYAFEKGAKRVLNRSNQARRRSMRRIMPRWMKASDDSSLRS